MPLTNKTLRQRQETKWLKGDSSYGEREKGGEDGGTEMEIEGHSFQVVVLALVVASGGPPSTARDSLSFDQGRTVSP